MHNCDVSEKAMYTATIARSHSVYSTILLAPKYQALHSLFMKSQERSCNKNLWYVHLPKGKSHWNLQALHQSKHALEQTARQVARAIVESCITQSDSVLNHRKVMNMSLLCTMISSLHKRPSTKQITSAGKSQYSPFQTLQSFQISRDDQNVSFFPNKIMNALNLHPPCANQY